MIAHFPPQITTYTQKLIHPVLLVNAALTQLAVEICSAACLLECHIAEHFDGWIPINFFAAFFERQEVVADR